MKVEVYNACANCKHCWKDYAGAWARHYRGCPKCGSRYWNWLNWRDR